MGEELEKMMKDLVKNLRSVFPTIKIIENANMAKYTSFKAGGNAKVLMKVKTLDELKGALREINDRKLRLLFLGNGSNTLFRDEGYDGIVMKLDSEGEDFGFLDFFESGEVRVGAANLMSSTAKSLAEKGLSGFEPLSGIPGSIGGAVFMNAGAYGGEMAQIVKSVHVVSKDGKKEETLHKKELGFGYRHSILEREDWIVTYVNLELKKGDISRIKAEMKSFSEKRNLKQPIKYPSAGSTFKRPEGYFAGKLIEDAGLKGLTVGGAQVSNLHSGFIINKGGATATDIIQLIALVQNTVYDKFGVKLEREVKIIG